MKSNVDLTENQIFSSVNFDDVIREQIVDSIRVPWKVKIKTISSEDKMVQPNSPIIVGNKSERAKVLEYRKMFSQKYCDCCGAKLGKKPWIKEIGLCSECDSYYAKKQDKCLWRSRSTWIYT